MGCLLNSFLANGLFLFPVKTSVNLWWSDIFRGHRKRPVTWNGLIKIYEKFSSLKKSLEFWYTH